MRKLRKMSLDDLSNAWLEFRYAFRPLFFEMVQAVNAFERETGKALRKTARGYAEDVSVQHSSGVVALSGWATAEYSRTLSLRKSSRAGVLYTVSSDANNALSVWGLDQPLESLWEIVPFSFIVDWFFNIGDIISSYSVNTALKPQGSWVTNRYELVETLKLKPETLDVSISGVDRQVVTDSGTAKQVLI
jgi:hypothetical protein